ncbi:MAG: hypothetical protein GX131_14620 [candidate division WS1 bacterium]|nr:hypothetical protein [candidate division WS1 bacterium]
MRRWLTRSRLWLLVAGMAVAILLGTCAVRLRSEFTPRRITTLEPIEERTGWVFPAGTRVVTAANVGPATSRAVRAVPRAA